MRLVDIVHVNAPKCCETLPHNRNIVEVFHIRFDLFPLATVARVSHVRSVLPSSNSSSSICHHHGSLPPNLTVSYPSPAMLHIMIKSRLARVTSDCLSDSAWAVRSAQIGKSITFHVIPHNGSNRIQLVDFLIKHEHINHPLKVSYLYSSYTLCCKFVCLELC